MCLLAEPEQQSEQDRQCGEHRDHHGTEAPANLGVHRATRKALASVGMAAVISATLIGSPDRPAASQFTFCVIGGT
jgi:hypothetical protein